MILMKRLNLNNIVLKIMNLKCEYILNKVGKYFLWVILIYYISIFMHELGHYLMSKLMGIRLKLFVVGPIKYINDNNEKALKFRFSGSLITGGFILPEINNEIEDRSKFYLYTNKYINILYGGPIFTFITIVISSLFIIVNKFTSISMIFLIINWSIFINIFSSSINVYGDYCLIDLLKRKPELTILMLSTQFASEYPINKFILEEAEEIVDKTLSKSEYNNMILVLINRIIDYKIINGQNLSVQCDKFKEWIFNYYFNSLRGNIFNDAKFIKVAYKILLHEYSIKKNKSILVNYEKFDKFLALNSYNNNKYLLDIHENLKDLYIRGKGFNIKFSKYVCDVGQIFSECKNYNKMLNDIINKL